MPLIGDEGSTAESKAAEGPEVLGPQNGLALLNSMKVAAKSMVQGLEMGRLMGGGPSGPIYQAWYNDMRCVIKVSSRGSADGYLVSSLFYYPFVQRGFIDVFTGRSPGRHALSNLRRFVIVCIQPGRLCDLQLVMQVPPRRNGCYCQSARWDVVEVANESRLKAEWGTAHSCVNAKPGLQALELRGWHDLISRWQLYMVGRTMPRA